MLYLDAPIGPINGLMIYRDHQDPDLFYYVPERPRLARNDGVPELVFYKYKRDITDNPAFDPETKAALGGGFLAFTVELGVDEDQQTEAKKQLAKFASGKVKLSPIQFRKGSVRLSVSKDAPAAEDGGVTSYEEVIGPGTPSLFGANRATFSLAMKPEMATLVFDALKNARLIPMGVIYDLEFLGLRPAFSVKVKANYHRVYEDLKIEFGARGQIYMVSIAADIELEFEKLRDKGVIKVEVLNFTDDQNIKKQADDAFNWFKTELLKDFFSAALKPPVVASGSTGLMGQLQGLLGSLGQPETGSSTPARGAPTNEAGSAAPAPTNLESGVPSTAAVNSAPAAGGSGGAATGMSPFQIAFTLRRLEQVEDKEREFDYSMQAAEARNIGAQGMLTTMVQGIDLTQAIKEINLDDEFFKRLKVTVQPAGDLSAAGINTVVFNWEYPGRRAAGVGADQADGFTFTPAATAPKVFNSWLNAKKSMEYQYKTEIHFNASSPWAGSDDSIKSADWIPASVRNFVINPLDFIDFLDVAVTLGSVNSTEISQVQVELRYEDPAHNFGNERTVVLKPGDPGMTWKLRLAQNAPKTYEYRKTYFLTEGNLRVVTDWIPSNSTSIVVNSPFLDTLAIRVVPILDPGSILDASLVIEYREPDTGYKRTVRKEFSSAAEMRPQTIVIPTLRQNPQTYGYEITVVKNDGSTYESGRTTRDLPTLLLADGAGTTHRVKVKLSNPDLAALGLVAVSVELTGLGEGADSESVFFTASQLADQTVALVQPNGGGTFTYKYKVTGYTLQGFPVAGMAGESTASQLVVGAPTP